MLKILYGTQSGNARNLARVIGQNLEDQNISSEVLDFADLAPESIHDINQLIIVTSTYGDGEPPDNASEWMSYLKFSEDLDLKHLSYAVLGLGDTYYPHFCQCGKDFDQYLSKHGGLPLVSRLDCDLYFEEQYGDWLKLLIGVLKNEHHG